MPLYGRKKCISDILSRPGVHTAVEEEALSLLQTSPGSLDEVDGTTGLAPIHIAVEKGFSRVVEQLIRAGCSVNVCTRFGGLSPALLAVVGGPTCRSHGCDSFID